MTSMDIHSDYTHTYIFIIHKHSNTRKYVNRLPTSVLASSCYLYHLQSWISCVQKGFEDFNNREKPLSNSFLFFSISTYNKHNIGYPILKSLEHVCSRLISLDPVSFVQHKIRQYSWISYVRDLNRITITIRC